MLHQSIELLGSMYRSVLQIFRFTIKVSDACYANFKDLYFLIALHLAWLLFCKTQIMYQSKTVTQAVNYIVIKMYRCVTLESLLKTISQENLVLVF